MDKLRELRQYSNPEEVMKIGRKYNLDIMPSTRKDKKYMIKPKGASPIHFGQMGYDDATKHNDPIRINNFKTRNAKWKNAEPLTPAWLSYHILWASPP